jgi:4-diphosphocytidyl-2-C-methyl-D-erythritol kinase
MSPEPAVEDETHREIAFAKINLALHVRNRREDGYHELETLFAFVDAGDILTVQKSDRISLNIKGPFAEALEEDDDNLVIRAARALSGRVGSASGAALTLTKNLPVASGIGGGSADAAATLRLLNPFWNCGLTVQDLQMIAAPLGADIPVCVQSRAAVGKGIGQSLREIDFQGLKGKPILLVNPGVPVSTAHVFQGWNGIDNGPLSDGDAQEVATLGRNDLEASARALCPEVADVLHALQETAPAMARMSGSGATCFGMYDDIDALVGAHARIKQANPDWWTLTGRLR